MTIAYNGLCYQNVNASALAYCADNYPKTYQRTATVQATQSCESVTAISTNQAQLNLRTYDIGSPYTSAGNTTIQVISFANCPATNQWIGSPSTGSVNIQGTVTAIGSVTSSGYSTVTGTITATTEPFTQEKAIAYATVFGSVLTMMVLIFASKQLFNLFRSGRAEV